MPTIIYVEPDGTRREVAVADGMSLMEGAIHNGVAGIVAECGGSCTCGTCHVYVDPARLSDLPPMDDLEDAMLDGVAAGRRENSRLSCQIKATPGLDGLILQAPSEQG